MPRKSSRKMNRKPCSNVKKRSCKLRKNCTYKKSRGCRRKRSPSRISKYEKAYKSVIKRAARRSRSKRSRSRKTTRKLTGYTKFVKENIGSCEGKTQGERMKNVAAMWRKQNKCKRGTRKCSPVCKKKPGPKRSTKCKRGTRKGTNVCKRKPGPKTN